MRGVTLTILSEWMMIAARISMISRREWKRMRKQEIVRTTMIREIAEKDLWKISVKTMENKSKILINLCKNQHNHLN